MFKHSAIVSFLCLLFGAALLFPEIQQFIHHLEDDHEHIVCSDSTVHLHEKVLECELHDQQINAFHFELLDYPNFQNVHLFLVRDDNYISFFTSEKYTTQLLRGPPSHS